VAPLYALVSGAHIAVDRHRTAVAQGAL